MPVGDLRLLSSNDRSCSTIFLRYILDGYSATFPLLSLKLFAVRPVQLLLPLTVADNNATKMQKAEKYSGALGHKVVRYEKLFLLLPKQSADGLRVFPSYWPNL
jgi:hypothetical protein